MWVSSEPAIDKAYRQTQTRLATVSSAIKAWRHQAGPWEHAAGFQPVPQARLARLEITKDRNSAWVGPHILPITKEGNGMIVKIMGCLSRPRQEDTLNYTTLILLSLVPLPGSETQSVGGIFW